MTKTDKLGVIVAATFGLGLFLGAFMVKSSTPPPTLDVCEEYLEETTCGRQCDCWCECITDECEGETP